MTMNRALKPLTYVLAGLYFAVDLLFAAFAKPVADWLARRQIFEGLRNWIVSLRPYPSLLLFAVPIILLEPVKPASLYFASSGHLALGATVFVVGEILKLVIIERLFSLLRDKLMSVPAFAWSYGNYLLAKEWATSLEAWQNMHRWARLTRHAVRGYILLTWPHRRISMQ
jgi:hypothetical protein